MIFNNIFSKKLNFPTFELVIDDSLENENGVDYVALVDKPAIEKNFLAFKDKQRFATNDDKRIIYGPALLADTPIYRKDEKMGEHYVVFKKPTIEAIAKKFFKGNKQSKVNLMHDPNQQQQSVTIFQSFITSEAMGIKPMKGFEDVPDGSWFMGAIVEDETLWSDIKSGKVKGFSVEGMFGYKKPEEKKFSALEMLSHEGITAENARYIVTEVVKLSDLAIKESETKLRKNLTITHNQIAGELKEQIRTLKKEKEDLITEKNRLYKLLDEKQLEPEGKSFIQEQRELRQGRIQRFHEKYG